MTVGCSSTCFVERRLVQLHQRATNIGLSERKGYVANTNPAFAMSLFNSFSTTIDEMPTEGIFGVLELERWMIEDDLARKRTLPIEEARSILSFCHFVDAVKHGSQISPAVLPMMHVVFYRGTVRRLIEAELLPFNTSEQFENTFSHVLFQSTAA
jgi:hypothetical protein